MQKTHLTDTMWNAFKAASGVRQDNYDVVAFGRGSGLETELAELVLSGQKRATAGLLCASNEDGEPLPMIGGYAVTVDGAGVPRCIWRTIELRLGSLNSVNERFVWDEGEGDRSRTWWLEAHRRLFHTRAERLGFTFSDDMETIFERFTVVWPPNVADATPR